MWLLATTERSEETDQTDWGSAPAQTRQRSLGAKS